jgi:hypothetical protein
MPTDYGGPIAWRIAGKGSAVALKPLRCRHAEHHRHRNRY